MNQYLTSTKFSFKIIDQSFILVRHVRNIARRREGQPKLLEGKVKTVTKYDTEESYDVKDFQDLVNKVRKSEKFNEIEIAKAFTTEEDLGTGIARSLQTREYDRKSKEYQSFVKKQIIQKKYFKFEVESNLLTYAAKLQIRYLNKLNPEEWTPETLSQHFPTTPTGVKKLLRSNYELRTPEKIKKHDEEVEQRWEILKARKHSDLITFYTQKMWDEGKILKENYKGNPNLPNKPASADKKIIEEEKNIVTGEYSAIIQQYIKYKREKDAHDNSKAICKADELQFNCNSIDSLKTEKPKNLLNKKKYIVYDETHSNNLDMISSKKKLRPLQETDVLLSQFKENLKEDMSSHKSELDSEYTKWIKQQSKGSKILQTSKKSYDTKMEFQKIPKFVKDSIELKKEKSKTEEHFYLYDDKLGYQHPKGKNIKAKIHVPSKLKKAKEFQVGNCVYDEDGELLYKIPS
ncbi:hypothetical protein CDAR_445421 [Caerostris darwini]|uniref:Neugrin n=1 Tax=Caerostris darwini TaxID=1538125 RepID=A0AAV4S9N6_9ARAC|nr:hypothetical protein CDAR_445421 [Caerostris darwini]